MSYGNLLFDVLKLVVTRYREYMAMNWKHFIFIAMLKHVVCGIVELNAKY
jgi:hypothetical protein